MFLLPLYLAIYHCAVPIGIVKWRPFALLWCSHLSKSELYLSLNVASGLPLPLSNKLCRLRLLSLELAPEEGTLLFLSFLNYTFSYEHLLENMIPQTLFPKF